MQQAVGFCWQFPNATQIKRNIPKTVLYDQLGANQALKQLFVEQVEEIVWTNIFSPRTLNINATDDVPELNIITIRLRQGELATNVLEALDKAMPRQVIWQLQKPVGETDGIAQCYIACYKHKAENGKWQCSDYLKSPWGLQNSSEIRPLPIATNTKALYQAMLKALLPLEVSIKPQENMAEITARLAKLAELEKKITALRAKLAKEKQFNRKITLNQELNRLLAEREVHH
ncbi:hypothetical protein APJL_0656 [Actinobacillus pleuropneumoniae serovar 3 str. JL03]|uniref:Methyl-accepting chemotaxis protein n=1 Tax=Actinobacillus pleuropneumoniae serotype 3 (strain JL03) TaxID=434271 RepID=B0BNU0_ACTPJ|nr:DUF4391 domain-containing protein [Actinobacillus pleuropneumoniae]ABY69225.1 hypothetical protein APJL_0656 [Actinobacillus pleuropneumoniae serovar 3 str. JL03]UKH14196.1 DUF4391 domain-containing protein [Actinobacillus pleuropneumoniae]UKH22368.1 DUF4391 domain-containing protein [Actinobacillus pleuropneumoniae]UKH43373.1 DUF4391 domain-containing protein [Actinobacillus pleuropneumoniae]USQ17308.1 DUF4391 domain-containing protein [Actinobacillus pleuropneumoniae]